MSDVALIPGLDGAYAATKDGQIISVRRVISVAGKTHFSKTVGGNALSAGLHECGYAVVSLRIGKTRKSFRVHRLILLAFQPVENHESLDVNHINGIKTDNRLENLEWCTRSENHKHRYRVLKQRHSMIGKYGARHHRAMPVIAIAPNGDVVARFDALMDAERAGYRASQISQCINGKRASHRGFRWALDKANTATK